MWNLNLKHGRGAGILQYSSSFSSRTEKGTCENVRGASEFIQKLLNKTKLKHRRQKKEKKIKKRQMEMKKHGRKGGKGRRRWKNVYFTESNMAQKVCMRDEQMNGGSRSPMCRSIEIQRQRFGLRCTGQR